MSKQAYRLSKRTAPIGADGIATCRRIAKECQYRKINEVCVDLFTASAVLAVYDKLSAANQTKLEALPVHRVASVCFKLLQQAAA